MEFDELTLLQEAREILELEGKSNKIPDEQLICECLCISAGEIRNYLKGNKADLDVLSRELKLGSGCSSCLKSFKQWVDKI